MGFGRSAAVVVFLAVLRGAGVWASELVVSDLTPEYIVERINEVTQGWEMVEIELAGFERRVGFDPPGSKPRFATRGRFVLTAADCGELTVYPVDAQGRRRQHGTEERFVWIADEFQIHSGHGHIERIPRAGLGKSRANIGGEGEDTTAEKKLGRPETDQAEPARKEQPVTLASVLVRWIPSIVVVGLPGLDPLSIPESPKDCLPLVFADAKTLADQFEMRVMEDDEHYFLFARPKYLDDQHQFTETALCLDRQTFIPIAKRNVLPGGDCYHWVATSLRVNGNEQSPHGICTPTSRGLD